MNQKIAFYWRVEGGKLKAVYPCPLENPEIYDNYAMVGEDDCHA